jgi:hypothetical protein
VGSPYTTIAFTDRLIGDGVDALAGFVGVVFDNLLSKSQIGLSESKLIHHDEARRNSG